VNAEKSGFVGVSGARIYYEVAGQGDPLVLINASDLDLRMWDQQVPEFARRFEVVRYDQVGIGRTRLEGDRPPLPHDLESHEEYLEKLKGVAQEQGFPTNHGDLMALLDSLGIGRARLLGLGLGANTAVDFALGYPDRTDALVLASLPHVWGNEPAIERLAEETRRSPRSLREALALAMPFVKSLFRRRDATPLIDMMLADPSYAPSEETARRRLRELLMDNGDAILEQRGRRYPLDFSTAGRLREIGAPTLVLYAEEHSPIVRETARLLEREIPAARKVAFPGACQFVNMERPEEFNRIVTEFLESI
jgi:3-oxoadipate enol-lactonase